MDFPVVLTNSFQPSEPGLGVTSFQRSTLTINKCSEKAPREEQAGQKGAGQSRSFREGDLLLQAAERMDN